MGFPSQYEAYPLVVLEALAHGLPVVATPIGPVPDLLEDGVNGFIVTADAREIRDRVVELAGMPRDRLRSAARATAEQHGWDRIARRYLTLLEGLGARFDLSADVDAETAGAAVS